MQSAGHELPERIGPYSILAPLGRGGMGSVYRALRRDTGQEAALKTVRLPHQAMLSSLRREIQALARIRHPGIVRILEHGVHDGLPWYAMQLLEGQTLRRVAAALHRAELLRRQVLEEPMPGLLRFSHDKLRERAYELIEPGRRRELHGAAAEALEQALERGAERPDALLGHHWEQAGRPDRARPHYLAAARAAGERGTLAEAEHLYRAYLRLTAEPETESVVARRELGYEVIYVQGRVDEALEQCRIASEEARRLQDCLRLVKCLCALGHICSETGRQAEAQPYYEEALDCVRRTADRRLEGQVLSSLAMFALWQDRSQDFQRLNAGALQIHREVQDRRAEIDALNNLAFWHHGQGRLELAAELYEQALCIAHEVGPYRRECQMQVNVALLKLERGHVEEARHLLERGGSGLERIGEWRWRTGAMLVRAALERRTAELAATVSIWSQLDRMLPEIQDPYYRVMASCERAHLALARGQPGSAREWLVQARQMRDQALQSGGGVIAQMAQAVERLERALAAAAAGRKLHRGECIEDLPAGLRQWLVETGRLAEVG